jgi:hypothetical protein
MGFHKPPHRSKVIIGKKAVIQRPTTGSSLLQKLGDIQILGVTRSQNVFFTISHDTERYLSNWSQNKNKRKSNEERVHIGMYKP